MAISRIHWATKFKPKWIDLKLFQQNVSTKFHFSTKIKDFLLIPVMLNFLFYRNLQHFTLHRFIQVQYEVAL